MIHSNRSRPALHLVEVLVVLACIAVAIALFFPATRRVQDASGRVRCQSQLRQIGIALHTSQDAYDRMPTHSGQDYPWPTGVTKPPPGWGKYQQTGQSSVPFSLLPFVDSGDLYQYWSKGNAVNSQSTTDPIDLRGQWPSDRRDLTGGSGSVVRISSPKLYICRGDPSGPFEDGLAIGPQSSYFGIDCPVSNYAFNYQLFRLPEPRVPTSMPDGSSTTAMAYERYAVCKGPGETSVVMNPWGVLPVDANSAIAYWSAKANQEDGRWARFQMQPRAAECDATRTQSIHSPGMNVLMGDASVKLVAPSVSHTTWHAAVTPDGKDKVGDDW